MFNEKKAIWIDIYKTIVILSFWGYLIGGILLGPIDGFGFIEIFGLGGISLFLWPIVGVILAFTNLVSGMLIINFLNNVQAIRMKIERINN